MAENKEKTHIVCKEISKYGRSEEWLKKYLKREIDNNNNLEHPHIVKFYGYEDTEDYMYMFF